MRIVVKTGLDAKPPVPDARSACGFYTLPFLPPSPGVGAGGAGQVEVEPGGRDPP